MSAQLTHEATQTTTTSPIGRTGLGRLRGAWSWIRLTVQDVNYVSRRIAEMQAPWRVDR